MRKALFPVGGAALATILLFAPAAGAAPVAPQIHDKSGDWVVPGQDITAGTISMVDNKVQAQLALTAAPAAGVRTVYAVVLYVGCVPYVFEYDWSGAATGSSSRLAVYTCKPSARTQVAELVQPKAVYPATAAVSGHTVQITAVPHGDLQAGRRVSAAAETQTGPVVVLTGLDSNDVSVGGDIAYAQHSFRL